MYHKGACVLDKIDCINDSFIKPCFQGPSEIFSPLFGCHQKFLQRNLGWGRAFGLEGEFEVADDSIHHRIISDKSDHFHLAMTVWTDEGIDLINFLYHLSPTSRGDVLFILYDQRMGWRDFSLAHLASMGIGVEAVIADHDLSFIRNMGGHTSDKLQIVHPLFLGLALSPLRVFQSEQISPLEQISSIMEKDDEARARVLLQKISSISAAML